MSECESCLTEAWRRSLTIGGEVGDRYREVVTERHSAPCRDLDREPANTVPSGGQS